MQLLRAGDAADWPARHLRGLANQSDLQTRKVTKAGERTSHLTCKNELCFLLHGFQRKKKKKPRSAFGAESGVSNRQLLAGAREPRSRAVTQEATRLVQACRRGAYRHCQGRVNDNVAKPLQDTSQSGENTSRTCDNKAI